MSRSRPLSQDLDARIANDPELSRQLRQILNESIGESLREARLAADLSQAHVAKVMGVTRSRISQIEAAEGTSLSLEVLSRYSHAVGCRLDIDLVNPATDEPVASIYVVDHPKAVSADEAGIRSREHIIVSKASHPKIAYWSDWTGFLHQCSVENRGHGKELRHQTQQATKKTETWANGNDDRLAA